MNRLKRIYRKVEDMITRLNLPRVMVIESSLFSSFYIRWLRIIHINKDADCKSHVIHEVAHMHLNKYFKSIIEKKEFERLFGRKNDFYFGIWYWTGSWEDYDKDPEYISLYAQTHPIEDYCETFCHAWQEIETGKEHDYGHRKLNTKVRTIKRWIRNSLLAG